MSEDSKLFCVAFLVVSVLICTLFFTLSEIFYEDRYFLVEYRHFGEELQEMCFKAGSFSYNYHGVRNTAVFYGRRFKEIGIVTDVISISLSNECNQVILNVGYI